MKKLILSVILIVGCDYAPTEHNHENEKIIGCTNEHAFNYNNLSIEDDGNCLFKVHFEIEY